MADETATPEALERQAERAASLSEAQALAFDADRLRREPRGAVRAAIRRLLRGLRR